MTLTLPYLVEAYLDRLGGLDRIGPDANAKDQAHLLAAAHGAAAQVETHFADMKASGAMKEMTSQYKAARIEAARLSLPFMGWEEYLIEAKRNSVLAIAADHAGEPLPVEIMEPPVPADW